MISVSGAADAKMGNWTANYVLRNATDEASSEANVYQSAYQMKVIHSLIVLICMAGILGNGTVIQILHFQIKRTPFLIYILNLVVADSGTLVFLFLSAIWHITTGNSNLELIECLVGTFCTGQFLLTIISIDRCLAVFFPIWHRYHQPPCLSTILCAVAWVVSFSVCAIHYTLILVKGSRNIRQFYHIFIYTIVCVPLVVASSLALFLKGYLQSQMKRRGKLLKAILLALLFFLIFSFPPFVIYLINLISNEKYFNLFQYGYLCACLNSSVNPLIYFLLGRKKKHQSMCNLKISLQRVFKEDEEESDEQPNVQVDIHL